VVKETEKKSANKKLEEKLFYKKESMWLDLDKKGIEAVFNFNEKYKEFMAKSKTERLCIKKIQEILEKEGFKNIDNISTVKKGEKFFKNFKGKNIIAAVAGEKKSALQLIGSHVDSPRLDLKPSPLYQNAEVALLQSHYYGGIKKFHWVNTPLEMHGVAFTKKGDYLEIHIGDKEDDPRFIIPDLLPHLSKDQMKKEADKIIEGEELNIICGHIPVNDKQIKDRVKLNVMKYLNEKYSLIEEDFLCAEIEFVPAQKPVDIGFDRGLVGAYGQDDRACAFASLMAILEIKKPGHTAAAFFTDKEEIGSYGDTGAESFSLINFTDRYRTLASVKESAWEILEKSKAISADVTGAMDPTFSSVNDPQNVSYLGRGVSIEKYGGGGGKYSTNDAHAEYMQYMRNLVNQNSIPWQTGEMGKVDTGGGGTIAMLMSRYGMDCVDAGPCLLGMHSVCEVASKADIYASFLLYRAFLGD
jgi:aspartyl aminopeptidase